DTFQPLIHIFRRGEARERRARDDDCVAVLARSYYPVGSVIVQRTSRLASATRGAVIGLVRHSKARELLTKLFTVEGIPRVRHAVGKAMTIRIVIERGEGVQKSLRRVRHEGGVGCVMPMIVSVLSRRFFAA